MSRRAYFYFLLTFLLGVVIGGFATVLVGWYIGHWRPRPPSPQHVARYLRRELNLTDAQAQQVEQIMRDTEKKFDDIHRQMEPQFQAVRDQSRDRIRQILNSEQLTKFNRLVQEWDERMKRRKAPPPH